MLDAGYALPAAETLARNIASGAQANGRAVLVPGFMAGAEALRARYGRAGWPKLLQPAIEDLDPAVEEAAGILGAGPAQTFFRVVAPALAPALLTGFTLSFSRALGEYGSVVFIAGNMPMKTEITSLLIVTKLEQFDYAGATALGAVQLGASFVLLFGINLVQWWTARKTSGAEV